MAAQALVSLRSRRSECFLGDQFLPQIRGQEQTEHERSERNERSASLPMPQIFCLARSIAKGTPGETPVTQITLASQAKALVSE